MHIDDAIKALKEAKKTGTKAIIFAYWESEMFERDDDETWAHDANLVEEEFDWSRTHDQLSAYLESLDTP